MTEAHIEAELPPPLPEGGLRIIPLGGLGAIGRNMTVFEYDGKLLIVDCGVLFPDVEQPGVDLILPDFGPILDRLADVQAIVLTHGHEDHIGAVPYLLAHKPDIPLVGSQFTLALVEAKLAERRIQPYTLTVREGGRERLGPFECEFFAVNHSIPDALAVAIRTPAGLVLHTGDFKMDQLPLDGRITDLAGFARLGAEGVDLLLSDSTNAEIPGFVTPEREIGPVLDSIFAKAKGRIIVASFASHVHRVQQVFDSAAEHGRKVALIGRSMVRNMGIARDLGLLNIPAGLVISIDEATTLPPDEIVLMSTGSQGEPMSALGRMASGDHRHITIAPGDTVVLASSLVPGNETSVYRVINRLARAGAVVVHKDVAKVHVSGHAPAGELLYLLNVVRPSNLMPVHGEWRHLRAHARLGIESGVAADRVVLCEDGDVVDLVEGRASVVGHVKSRYVYVDGLAVGDVSESLLTERRILGDGGFIATTVVVDSVTGKVVAGPTLSAKGFSEDPEAFNPVVPLVTEALNRAAADGITDPHQLQQIVRRTVGRWVNDKYRRRPMIVPTVVEV
ncbi:MULTISPECIES: ribonuclease J [Micromonospora]|uniref:Ribonuclease J n=1 Tax=Micromonospora saelicesensis TaxID=285676 RepID=A0A1C4X3Y4_9ACTN|nr:MULTISPECIES: ribonuclease J [Micromonospora]WTI09656.1 ribonuclease J [Micromonospora sp. NBC_00821]MCX5118165.1 ribonuclease J [Micromonospora sp. NBC_00362]RAO34917.1 Ribonuclease J [Micromonospora saelicesensis]RAO44403.1 Ribonuclease J [Micromonospora saelicesensis]RAO59465.1 Ribonuclease J [Micromonospora saelicesensis]